jgi:hypothetical protein
MDSTFLDSLRYRGEGVDLDFKQAQYRFVGGHENEKAELLKDILAMANSWRAGTAYILLGFKEVSGGPAEVVGINESINDAALQQFVGSKVKPTLEFKYQEPGYEGKTVGVISIPKQSRPFFLEHRYGGLKSNVVYVRRGSSTVEADPLEVIKMGTMDSGRSRPSVEISVTQADFSQLESVYERRYFSFEELPDYRDEASIGPYGLPVYSENRDYWREFAEFVQIHCATVELQFCLKNTSGFALTGTKLEVRVHSIEGPPVALIVGRHLPECPNTTLGGTGIFSTPLLGDYVTKGELRTTVDEDGESQVFHARLGKLLPGESLRASDTLGIRAMGPGKVLVAYRLLAEELEQPMQFELEVEFAGKSAHLNVEGLEDFLHEPIAITLLGKAMPQLLGND